MENLIEIFSSVQGEGKYIGCRQIFVRFSDCNLRCAYCDTNFGRTDFCNVENFSGAMKFSQIKNPVSAEKTADIIKKFHAEVPAHSVSFTGGEPLLHGNFISKIAELLKNTGLKIFLETNGTLFEEFEKIFDSVDIVSMDIKLPSITGKNFFPQHEKFLELARKKDFYSKIVVSDETTLEEFNTAVDLIFSVAPKSLLILQPVTPVGKIKSASAEKILFLQSIALKKLSDVRIIPQTHKFINLL
ncbi:MAG: 7-carboxy-7-deazaguanine synthase QueE [Selenomonadaceae bacterium]|nr:7-carboxy-7-deazaguanine synthase QueE [Selenomonadaceae bacterium]